jgi:hypothetical protein
MARKPKADPWSIKLARLIQIINGPMLATLVDARAFDGRDARRRPVSNGLAARCRVDVGGSRRRRRCGRNQAGGAGDVPASKMAWRVMEVEAKQGAEGVGLGFVVRRVT